MKCIVTGGGTGGHIYPALAIAKRLKKEYPEIDILYIGTKNGLESEIVPKEGIEYKTVRVKGFRRKISFDTLHTFKELFFGLNDARKIIKTFKPDFVVGTGGFVSGPVLFMASLKKIPTLIHEQNALPGITNKLLSRFVNRIAASFEESKKYFANVNKVYITGNPIRDVFINIDKQSAYNIVKINPNKRFVFSFGGSGGQSSLNKAMLDFILKNSDNDDIQILHVTGKRHYNEFKEKMQDINVNNNVRVLPYIYNIAEAMAVADLVITSAGAITIAEVTAVGAPSILIPKSYTAENHQEYNARVLEKKGASKVVLEKDLNGSNLNNTILSLLNDEDSLDEMRGESKKLAKLDSTDKIIELIKDII